MRTSTGQRRIAWEAKLLTESHWEIPAGTYMSKRELRIWLKNFKASEWPQFTIKSVIIYRNKFPFQSHLWEVEKWGYTDVMANGTLAPIEI